MSASVKRWLWVCALMLAAIVAAAAVMRPRLTGEAPSAAASSVSAIPSGVGCRGRIEPEDGVLTIAAPYFAGRPSLISELQIKEGDWVTAGQVLGVLDGWRSSEKLVRQSEADAEVARRRLAQVKAGVKSADLEAQRMEVARWQSEYEISRDDYQRYERLHESQVIAPAELDQKRLLMDRAGRTLDGAKERLKSLEEVRAEDVDVRSAELAAALAQVEHARSELDRMIVKAPVSGRVLKIHAYPGEEVGPRGILELARTDRMYVVAEVFESDIPRVRVGQKATISGDLVPDGIVGTVTQIGGQVTKSELLPSDPADFADTRVVNVKIQLHDGERVAGLIYGTVDVRIE